MSAINEIMMSDKDIGLDFEENDNRDPRIKD